MAADMADPICMQQAGVQLDSAQAHYLACAAVLFSNLDLKNSSYSTFQPFPLKLELTLMK